MARKEVDHLRENLRLLCADRRQEDVATAAGISRVYLNMIINGRATPSIEIVSRLAEALGVSVADLLEEPAETAA